MNYALLLLLFLSGFVNASDIQATRSPIVNDVTQINPIPVAEIQRPATLEQIQELVKNYPGPISIGGGHFSMGGQTASEHTLHLDLRDFNKVLEISKAEKTIRVQSGITWRKIQEAIDPMNLSLKIMQTYANFTVGGSLSVNVHGRYMGQGPLIRSVRSIKVVLADGQLIEASPRVNPKLFDACIGGYGGIGVIVEATLDLVDNTPVKRNAQQMPFNDYPGYFFEHIRSSPQVVFHNADLYPPHYDSVMAISWEKTDEPVTVPDRLHQPTGTTLIDRLKIFGVSDMPFGKELRSAVYDPLILKKKMVVWRNFEASYDVAELEPRSRLRSTFVLQEYFVPVDKLGAFVPMMAAIFQKHKVNVLNVSIRHALPDTGSIMAWARQESFALVVYYKQGTAEDAKKEVGAWTRELIDAVLSVDGTYYLPYQLHATREQFFKAYPRATEFFAYKAEIDPDNRFRNKLWDTYYQPSRTSAGFDRSQLKDRVHYQRPEEQTFLTVPEWYIVFSYDEYAQFIAGHRPSEFPYWGSIAQFWRVYHKAYQATARDYPFNGGYHLMNAVIGVSFTVEYALKSLLECTVGRFFEWIGDLGAPERMTSEDVYIAALAEDYVKFIRLRPWYEFAFLNKVPILWAQQPRPDTSLLRRWERRLSFTLELLMKAAWGQLITWGSQAAYEPDDLTIEAVTNKVSFQDPRVTTIADLDAHTALVSMPRYESFTATVPAMVKAGFMFKEIAGNQKLLVTFLAPDGWTDKRDISKQLYAWPVLTQPGTQRVALIVPVTRLHEALESYAAEGLTVDHMFDY